MSFDIDMLHVVWFGSLVFVYWMLGRMQDALSRLISVCDVIIERDRRVLEWLTEQSKASSQGDVKHE